MCILGFTKCPISVPQNRKIVDVDTTGLHISSGIAMTPGVEEITVQHRDNAKFTNIAYFYKG